MISKPEPFDKEQHVNSNKTIMCKVDPHGIIEYANEYFVELTGYSEGEIIGESLNLISHPSMPKVINNLIWNELKRKQKTFGIIKYISKSGSYYWLQVKFDFKVNEDTRELLNIYLYAFTPDRMSILELEKFYKKLNRIEKEASFDVSQKFLSNYLENSKLTYSDFIQKYIKN